MAEDIVIIPYPIVIAAEAIVIMIQSIVIVAEDIVIIPQHIVSAVGYIVSMEEVDGVTFLPVHNPAKPEPKRVWLAGKLQITNHNSKITNYK